jgi:hypothetical protein
MEDYLKVFKQHNNIKDIVSLIGEIEELRDDYRQRKYSEMQELIGRLMGKYFVETCLWNSVNTVPPTTNEEKYLNAENFLRLIGYKILLQNGVDIQNNVSKSDLEQIKSMQ